MYGEPFTHSHCRLLRCESSRESNGSQIASQPGQLVLAPNLSLPLYHRLDDSDVGPAPPVLTPLRPFRLSLSLPSATSNAGSMLSNLEQWRVAMRRRGPPVCDGVPSPQSTFFSSEMVGHGLAPHLLVPWCSLMVHGCSAILSCSSTSCLHAAILLLAAHCSCVPTAALHETEGGEFATACVGG